MLSKQPSDAEIKKVLESIGAPAKLAEQYRQNPRYLIFPQVYDEYIRLLKLLVPIVGIITLIVGAVSGVFETLQESDPQVSRGLQVMFQSGIQSGVSGVLQTLVWTNDRFCDHGTDRCIEKQGARRLESVRLTCVEYGKTDSGF